MQYQNCSQPVEGVSNLPPQSQAFVQAPIPPPVSQFSEGVVLNDNQVVIENLKIILFYYLYHCYVLFLFRLV